MENHRQDEDNPLSLLKNMPMLLAYTYKVAGEDGVKSLFGDKLTGREYILGWSAELRAIKLIMLANLLDTIASRMPSKDVLVNADLPHGFCKEQETAWKAYVEAHKDDARVVDHDRRWKQARAEWLRRTGAKAPCAI